MDLPSLVQGLGCFKAEKERKRKGELRRNSPRWPFL